MRNEIYRFELQIKSIMSMFRTFNNRFRDFIINVSKKSMPYRNIATYFDLPCKENEHMSITLTKHPLLFVNCLVLNIKYCIKIPIENISTIPIELIKKIYSYASYEYIDMSFKITFPVDYPFSPPTWSLMEEKNNVSYSALTNITIRDYFQELTTIHNEQYKRDAECNEYDKEKISKMSDLQRKRTIDYYYWSPAITIEKDVLSFIKRINYFNYILQPNYPFEAYSPIEKKTSVEGILLSKPSWKFIVVA